MKCRAGFSEECENFDSKFERNETGNADETNLNSFFDDKLENKERKLIVDDQTKTKKKREENKKKRIPKRFVFVCVSRFFLVCLLISILIFIPFAKVFYDNHKDDFSEIFFGKKSKFQGVLRLWNVDSFEGGTSSKSGFLEKVSMLFEKKNKGVFVMVQNMTEDEVVASLKAGTYPDLVSFGTGMNKYFDGKLVRFDDKIAINILPNFYSAGLKNGALVAVPFMTGVYSLICSTERIESCEKDSKLSLSTLAFALASEKTKKGATTFVNSLTFGTKTTSAFDAFSRKFKSSSLIELVENHIVDGSYNSQTPYQAYESFALKKSSMLLGTQRDIVRMQNRVLAGKESDLLFEPISEWTDLVQYAGILCSDKNKYDVCCDFVSFLLEESTQKLLKDIGMFSVLDLNIYDDLVFSKLEKVVNDEIVVKSTFN